MRERRVGEVPKLSATSTSVLGALVHLAVGVSELTTPPHLDLYVRLTIWSKKFVFIYLLVLSS